MGTNRVRVCRRPFADDTSKVVVLFRQSGLYLNYLFLLSLFFLIILFIFFRFSCDLIIYFDRYCIDTTRHYRRGAYDVGHDCAKNRITLVAEDDETEVH